MIFDLRKDWDANKPASELASTSQEELNAQAQSRWDSRYAPDPQPFSIEQPMPGLARELMAAGKLPAPGLDQ